MLFVPRKGGIPAMVRCVESRPKRFFLFLGLLLGFLLLSTGLRADQVHDGDVAPRGNPDGQVDIADALILQRIASGLITPTADELIHGDIAPICNQDGIIDVSDALVAIRLATGQLTLDLTPPVITITSHNNNDTVYNANVTISGAINDSTASVYVNGTPATVSNGTYSAGVTLGAGPNTIIVDAIDTCQNQSQLQITLNYSTGPTNVSGNIITNTAWSVAGSPYIVGGNLTVNPGITLTVEQGTEVKIGSTYGLIVNGSLVINGAESSPVTFTSNAAVKAAGDWQGIKITRNVGSVLQIDHAVIEYSNYGIQYSISGGADSLSITNSTIRESLGKGVYIEVSGSGVLTAALDNNDIYNHSSHGVHTYTHDTGSSLNLDITDSRIHDLTTGMGIYAQAGTSGAQDLLMDQDVITNTGDHGIYVYNTGHYGSTTAVVTGNQITGSKNNGIYFNRSYGYNILSVTIKGNTIVNGGTYGIHTSSGSSQPAYPYTLEVSGNTVSGSGTGIYLENGSASYYSRLDLFNNTLTGTGTGGTNYGIYAYSNTTAGDFAPVIMANQVSGYGGHGIYCRQGSASTDRVLTPVIAYNNIQNNGGDGLWLETSTASPVVYNNVTGNTGYALNNQGVYALDARYNWWGVLTTMTMDQGGNPKNINDIYDVYDGSTKGTVTYDPWLSQALTVSGLPLSHLRGPEPNTTIGGGGIRITGVAAAGSSRVTKVEVSFDGGTTWNQATGTNTWTYDWIAPLDGNYTILTRVTDSDGRVEVPHAGTPVTVVASAIPKYGTVLSNQTWSGTVNLEGDITIPSGVTITIAPGTQILFRTLHDKSFGGTDSNNCELRVEGSLIAQGTGASPIIFSSAAGTPQKGNWQGIILRPGANSQLSLDYATVEYAKTGIDYQLATGLTGNFSITNSTIRHNLESGISVRSIGMAKETTTISHNVIQDNNQYGIYYYADNTAVQATPTITFNDIQNNDYGVYLRNATTPRLRQNNMMNNTTYGLYNYSTQTPVDATLNWWGSATGPSGNGPGSGNAISVGVIYDPWLGGAFQDAFYADDAYFSIPAFTPGGVTNIQITLSGDANWTITFKDQAGNIVDTITGTGTTISTTWDVSQYPQGTYTYTVTAVETATSKVLVPFTGTLTSWFPTVSINDPDFINYQQITLNLNAPNAVTMILSESLDFAGAQWTGYSTSANITLSGTEGLHRVYVKFRDKNSNEGSPVSDTATFDVTPPVVNVTYPEEGEVFE